MKNLKITIEGNAGSGKNFLAGKIKDMLDQLGGDPVLIIDTTENQEIPDTKDLLIIIKNNEDNIDTDILQACGRSITKHGIIEASLLFGGGIVRAVLNSCFRDQYLEY